MSKKAQEIYEYAKRKREALDKDTFLKLKEKAVEAVTEMMQAGLFFTEIEIEDEDLLVLSQLIKEMQGLGYGHCLIETQDKNQDIVGHRLRISVSHYELI